MTFSYDPARTTLRDEVRFLVGDYDDELPLLTDEDYDYLLAKNNNLLLRTGWRACEYIVALLSKRYNESIGPLNDDNPIKWTQYKELCEILKKRSIAEEGTSGLNAGRSGPPVGFGMGETFLGPKDEDFTSSLLGNWP